MAAMFSSTASMSMTRAEYEWPRPLEIPVRSGPLLDCLHPFGQECICLEAVQRAVIDREGDVDHRAR